MDKPKAILLSSFRSYIDYMNFNHSKQLNIENFEDSINKFIEKSNLKNAIEVFETKNCIVARFDEGWEVIRKPEGFNLSNG